MARRVPWRRVCPDVVASRIDEAIQARIYLLRETGPTGFLLKEDGSDRKLKVCFRKLIIFTKLIVHREHSLATAFLLLLLRIPDFFELTELKLNMA